LLWSFFVFDSQVFFCEDGFEFVAGVGCIFFGSLFAVDYSDDFFDGRAGVDDDLGGFEDLSAGGGDVLYEQNYIVRL
jgi:hypothetical protein